MAGKKSKQRFTVFLQDEGEGHETPIGKIEIDENVNLKLVDVVEPKEFLVKLINEMNAKNEIRVETPTSAEMPRYANRSRIVSRGDPEFLFAMREYLEKYHGIRLE